MTNEMARIIEVAMMGLKALNEATERGRRYDAEETKKNDTGRTQEQITRPK